MNEGAHLVTDNPILWRPSKERIEASAMCHFLQSRGHADYQELYDWSVRERANFWVELARFVDLRFDTEPETVLTQTGDMTTARWFEGATINFAQHLLRHTGDRAAIVFRGEKGPRRELSFDELRSLVASTAAGLRQAGVGSGDRVCGFLPNCPEAVIAMLGAASIGAVWSSCSPDFGIGGVVDRFGQIAPKVLICADGYFYGGKRFDSLAAVDGVLAQVASIETTVIVPFTGKRVHADRAGYVTWEDFLVDGSSPDYTPLPFNHPLYVLYSSGTTGVPKCMVHGAGGTLLQHLKEHVLHLDVKLRRAAVLFHHLRLDDVELAGKQSRRRCHAGVVRRGTVFRRGANPLGARGVGACHAFRNQRKVHRCPGKSRHTAGAGI